MNVTEKKMLRWSCGVTKVDRVRNEGIRGMVKITEISKKIHERRLNRFGDVMGRNENYLGKRVMVLEVLGTRRRGRPKRRWMDCAKENLEEKGVIGDKF